MTEALPSRRILVIDDEEVVHQSLRRILTRLGIEVEAVLTAAEGIARLERGGIALVITDLMMPGMGGIELLQELGHRGIHVPALMITGYPTIRTAVKALRLGAVDYIAKPYTRKELLGPVKRALRLEEPPRDATLPSPAGAPTTLLPGERVMLPHHAWAEAQQDGTFIIGLDPSFLLAAGEIAEAEGPGEMDLLEQGFIGIRLTNRDGDVHGVAMPLSGQVIAVNDEALSSVGTLSADLWLVRIIPSQLPTELEVLVKK